MWLSLFAFFRCARRECLAFLAIGIYLVTLSFGGPVAMLTYYFPGMSLYRHIGLVFGQVRIFLLFAAGFGIDQFIANARSGETNSLFADLRDALTLRSAAGRIRALLLITVAAECFISFFNPVSGWFYSLLPSPGEGLNPLFPFPAHYSALGFPSLPIFRLVIYGICLVLGWLLARRAADGPAGKPVLVHLLLVAFIADIGSFKLSGMQEWPLASAEQAQQGKQVFAPRKLTYRDTRVNPAELWGQSKEMQFLTQQGGHAQCMYSHVWTVAGVDPSIAFYRTDFVSTYVTELFRQRGSKYELWPNPECLRESDVWLNNAVAAGHPKLRLVSASDLDARDMETDPPRPSFVPLMPLGRIGKTEITYDTLSTQVSVTSPVPVRLYYSDAFHPGWKAFVNGQEVPVARTNFAFKSILLQAGDNTVKFVFFNGWGAVCVFVLAYGSMALLGYAGFALANPIEGQKAGTPAVLAEPGV